MYENGRQMNRYANKMIHKRKQKNLYRRLWFGGFQASSWEDYAAHARDSDPLKYWKTYYLSGPKRYAKQQTNNIARARFREDVSSTEYEDMYAPQRAEYQRFFDFCWTVW